MEQATSSCFWAIICVDIWNMKFYSLSMKKALTFCLVLAIASIASAQNWFKGTLEDATAKAKSDNKLVLIDFYSYT